jgi:uncharacterized protein YecE (DUF72 family)
MGARMRIRVGLAGWSNPPAKRFERDSGQSHLSYYAAHFSCVEINSSFYRPHQSATYARWRDATPAAFRFSVKMPRSITHESHLKGCAAEVARFYKDVAALQSKLAAVLVQLPPSLEFNARAVRAFFNSLPRLRGTQVVCEPRHPSWFTNAAASILQDAGISRVAADPARCLGAEVPGGARRLAYFRWHGSPHVYYSKYSAAQLTTFAAAVNTNKAAETWCVFDNTAHYAAWDDALQFAAALQPMQRVQLKRCKGWRMPANTVKVDRTTRWGNHPAARAGVAGAEAVRVFAQWVDNEAPEDWKSAALLALQKKNLACWCKEGASCHADFLISWIASCQQTSMK